MFAACQRLRRRALVVLAWLVLALSVAPAAGGFDPVRPVAAFVSEASRAGVARSFERSQRVASTASQRRLPSAPRSPVTPSLRQARSTPSADTSTVPAPDERWLYLKNNALLC